MSVLIEEPVATREKLREIIPEWDGNASLKDTEALNHVARAFIERCPYVVISSLGKDGRHDLSPRGDAAGFVTIHDDKTLIIPDRPGNHRVDTFENLLHDPRLGMFFLIPGHTETLRIAGTGCIARDRALREPFAVKGRLPEIVLVVTVEQAFMHCSKSSVRSRLWKPETWTDAQTAPTLAHWVKSAVDREQSLEEIQGNHDRDRQNRLY